MKPKFDEYLGTTQDNTIVAPIEIILDRELTKIELRILLAIISLQKLFPSPSNPELPNLEDVTNRVGHKKVAMVEQAILGLKNKGWVTEHRQTGSVPHFVYQYHVPDRLMS